MTREGEITPSSFTKQHVLTPIIHWGGGFTAQNPKIRRACVINSTQREEEGEPES